MMWFWWWYESVLESNLYHFIVIDLGAPQKSVAFEWLNITTTHSNGFFSFVFNILFAFLNMSFENVFDRYEWTRMRVCSLCVVRSENQNIAVKNENQINNDFGREKYGAAADCSNFGCGHISAAPTPHATRSTVHANCRLHSTCKCISVHINRCRYWRRSVICTTFFFLPLIVVGAHMRGWLGQFTMLWCRTAHWTLPIFDSLHFVLRLLNSWCASMRWTWFVSPWFCRPCKQKTRCFTIPFRRRIYLFLFLSLLFFLLYFSFSFFFLGSCSTMLRILEWNAFWSIGFNGCYRLGGGLRIVTQHAIPFPDTHTQSARMSFCSCGAHAPFGRLSIGSWIVIERGQLWPHTYIIIRRHD